MRVHKKVLSRLDNSARGLLPFPAIIAIIYGTLCYLIHLSWMCSMGPAPTMDYWCIPLVMGLSAVDLLLWLNILLIAYLLVSVWAFAVEKRNRTLRALPLWAAYLLSLVALIYAQVWIQRIHSDFVPPDEIVEIRMKWNFDGRRPELEDIALPITDICERLEGSPDDRCIIVITRPGHYVENRLDLGLLDHSLELIRDKILLRSRKSDRDPDGNSKMFLHLRVDRIAEFRHVQSIIDLCREKQIAVDKLELACVLELDELAPGSLEKVQWYYLPEGKISLTLPAGDRASERIPVELVFDKKSEGRYQLILDGRKIDGAEMPEALHRFLLQQLRMKPDAGILIRAGERVTYGQVFQVLTECLRTGAEDIDFESSSP
jgi:biopolymer transport protein ExbD